MTEEDAKHGDGRLPQGLLLKLQLGRSGFLAPEEAAIVEACLATDPRTEVLILLAIEFCLEDEYPDSQSIAMLGRAGKAGGSIRLLLRLAACRSLEKRGSGTLSAMKLLDALGEGERIRAWFFVKAVGMQHFDLWHRDEQVGIYISSEGFDWLYQRAFDRPDLVPLLFADGKSGQKRRRKELLNILARQTEDFLQDYDLGDLSEPLQELRGLIDGVADPKERTRICESKLGLGEFAPPSYVPPPDLTSDEVAAHQQMAEADQNVSYEAALAVLCRRSAPTLELNSWLEERLGRITPNAGSWARLIAWNARDLGLARKAMEHLLQEPDRRNLNYPLARFCGPHGPGKLPSEEGVDLIRRALAVKLGEPAWDECDKADLWMLMVREYGDHVLDFSDLLMQVEKGSFESARADDLVSELWRRGRHREEIRTMVERRFTPPYHSELPPRNRLTALSLLKTVESPLAWELWMKAAEEWHENSGRVEALDLLAARDAASPEFIGLLQRLAPREDYVGQRARHLLAAYSPSAFRVGEATLPKAEGNAASYCEPSEGFDAEGFQRWQEKAEERRQKRMAGVADGRERWSRMRCAHSLAFWFGDHPETLPCLIDRVRQPTRPDVEDPCPEPLETNWNGDNEHEFRQHCLKIIACRWPADERVHVLAKWAINHPWLAIRDEAARILARDHASSTDTLELLERHLADSDVVFEEYIALRHRDTAAMWKAVDALAQVDPECYGLSRCGPNLLARAYGPRKDLRQALEKMAAETSNKALRESIQHLFAELW